MCRSLNNGYGIARFRGVLTKLRVRFRCPIIWKIHLWTWTIFFIFWHFDTTIFRRATIILQSNIVSVYTRIYKVKMFIQKHVNSSTLLRYCIVHCKNIGVLLIRICTPQSLIYLIFINQWRIFLSASKFSFKIALYINHQWKPSIFNECQPIRYMQGKRCNAFAASMYTW